MISLTILVENSARAPGLLAEHGLAYWLEVGTKRVLFDTGQGMVLAHNAGRLGIDLAQADAIVLSHGHFDHVGGLEQALAAAPRAALWLHPRATEPKFSGPTAARGARRISLDFVEQEKFRAGPREVVSTLEAREVVPGLWATGQIPRTNSFEDTGGPFFLDAALAQPDPLLDDQALFFDSGDGLVVVLGCAHAGVVNTLRHVVALTGCPKIHTVVGGMHLENASPVRMAQTLAALPELGVQRLIPLHCTGLRAFAEFRAALGEKCLPGAAGTRLEFTAPQEQRPARLQLPKAGTSPQELALSLFRRDYNCAQAVVHGFCGPDALLDGTVLPLACGFGGGLGRAQEVCGAVAGGVLVLGLRHGRALGDSKERTENTYRRVRALLDSFTSVHGSCRCRDLLSGCELNTAEGQAEFHARGYRSARCERFITEVVAWLEADERAGLSAPGAD